jgi:cyclophilin family peptidyl-prolyl cis-trans isomerase/HEAT repeat protein
VTPSRRSATIFWLLFFVGMAAPARAQMSRRVAILEAEDRRATRSTDVATMRLGARSSDSLTAQFGLRALGRLERPALIPDILPGLRHALPEVREEAANAVAQAAQGFSDGASSTVSLTSVLGSLTARLKIEAEPDVRSALCEAIGRLPYASADDARSAESALVDFGTTASTDPDRLGVAKGLEALTRLRRDKEPRGASTVSLLRTFAAHDASRTTSDLLHDARVRRLAMEALLTVHGADLETLKSAADDPDPQVRRLAVRAATITGSEDIVTVAMGDSEPMVRIEALRAARQQNAANACVPSLVGASDSATIVALVAIDQLAACGRLTAAVSYLERSVADLPDAEAPRNWHRAAHALIALATSAPERARQPMTVFAGSRVWQLRMYAARAAAILRQREQLDRLVHDDNDNVVEAAIVALGQVAGHDADEAYIGALGRDGFQVIRAAALALEHSPARDRAVPPLKEALTRVDDDGRAGAVDARGALRAALDSMGSPVRASKPPVQPAAPITAANLTRLRSPRARFVIRDVGTFDVALFTMEAPATVLRFAELATSGYYDGTTFHRVVPNGVVQGGGPGANEFSSDAPMMRDEVGLWPHVRGAFGISTRGRDTGDGQIFIDLVDNPRYDHTYTVFAQVLNGMDIVDRILEGDVIERVDIIP